MKKTILLFAITTSVFFFFSCGEKTEKDVPVAVTAPVTEAAKPDLAQIRTEIVAVENQWAAAINAKDINALMALYAEDAVSMQDAGPALVGKAAIQKKQEMDFAAPSKFASIAFETSEVFAQGDVVTELGKTFYKDAAGKTTGTGKYIALFEKKNGKYVCIREIYNSDTK